MKLHEYEAVKHTATNLVDMILHDTIPFIQLEQRRQTRLSR